MLVISACHWLFSCTPQNGEPSSGPAQGPILPSFPSPFVEPLGGSHRCPGLGDGGGGGTPQDLETPRRLRSIGACRWRCCGWDHFWVGHRVNACFKRNEVNGTAGVVGRITTKEFAALPAWCRKASQAPTQKVDSKPFQMSYPGICKLNLGKASLYRKDSFWRLPRHSARFPICSFHWTLCFNRTIRPCNHCSRRPWQLQSRVGQK